MTTTDPHQHDLEVEAMTNDTELDLKQILANWHQTGCPFSPDYGKCHNADCRNKRKQLLKDLDAHYLKLFLELVGPLKESNYGLNMAVKHNPPSNTTRTNLYRNGFNEAIKQTIAAANKRLGGVK